MRQSLVTCSMRPWESSLKPAVSHKISSLDSASRMTWVGQGKSEPAAVYMGMLDTEILQCTAEALRTGRENI